MVKVKRSRVNTTDEEDQGDFCEDEWGKWVEGGQGLGLKTLKVYVGSPTNRINTRVGSVN